MWTNLLLVLGVLAAVTVGCLLKRSYDGRFRPARASRRSVDHATGARQPAAAPVSRTTPDGQSAVDSTPWHETGRDDGSVLGGADLGQPLGERATLVQFSSAFCAPCRATRTVLADIATTVPGVRHIEVDAESNLELVRRLGVVRTPTTFVVDAGGRVRTRASGLARRGPVVAALDAALDDPAT